MAASSDSRRILVDICLQLSSSLTSGSVRGFYYCAISPRRLCLECFYSMLRSAAETMALLMANTKKGEKGEGDQYKRDLRLSRDCFFFFSRSHKYIAAEEKFSLISGKARRST